MSKRKGLFLECRECGERWKIATVPVNARLLAQMGNVICPNCFANGDRVGLCPTEGPEAVSEARNGKAGKGGRDEA